MNTATGLVEAVFGMSALSSVDTFRGFLWTYIGWTQCALIRSYASVVYVEAAFGKPCTFTETEKRRMQLDLDRLTMYTSWCYDVTKDNTITRIS
mgnify:CR=1 FL=1